MIICNNFRTLSTGAVLLCPPWRLLVSMDYNGYLPKQICQFLHQVKDDKYGFTVFLLHILSLSSVLLFPALPSRLRYLIHNQVEDLPELTTFSVGESWCRRVVVCHSELSRYEEPLSSRSREELGGGHAKRKPAIASRSRGPKRPDKPLYMPRAARDRLSLQNSHGPSDHELPSPVSTSNSCMSSSDSCYCPETTENTKTTSRQERLPSVTDAIPNHVGDIAEVCPQGLHEAEPSVCDETTSCFADMTLEDDENDEEDLGSVSFRTLTEEVSLCMVLMAG
uniref:R3H domain-containing protein n=1 Tax=Sparus aurata TaxID=8175 RepID=A0A671TIP3_SPAAU